MSAIAMPTSPRPWRSTSSRPTHSTSTVPSTTTSRQRPSAASVSAPEVMMAAKSTSVEASICARRRSLGPRAA
jgi:hypothetical protein